MMRSGGYGSWAPAMGAVRGRRELYDPYYRQLHRAAPGPSAWMPATILAVVLLIMAVPYMRPREITCCYYRRRGGVRGASSFPLPLLWISVAGFIALQFFSASKWHQGDRYRAPAGTWPWSSYHYRHTAHQHRGVVSTFDDFGGYWLLILLGIAVFTLALYSSAHAAPRLRAVPLAPRMLRFPWSCFF